MLATLAFAAAVAAPPVCPDPAKPCPGFRPHDLSFPLPSDGVARAEVRSAPFFAVILVSGAPCRFTERERAEAQALFPQAKVFNARFGCDGDVENNVSYSGVDPKAGFLAVHGGPIVAQETAGRRYLSCALRCRLTTDDCATFPPP